MDLELIPFEVSQLSELIWKAHQNDLVEKRRVMKWESKDEE